MEISRWWSSSLREPIKIETDEEFLIFSIASTLLGRNWYSGLSYLIDRKVVCSTLPIYVDNQRQFSRRETEKHFNYGDIVWDVFDNFKEYNWITQLGSDWYVTELEPKKGLKGWYSKVPRGSKIKAIGNWSPSIENFKPIKIAFPKSGN